MGWDVNMKRCTNSDLLCSPLSKTLGIVKGQRTGHLNSMSLLIRKKTFWFKEVSLTKLYLKKVMTASAVQLWTNVLPERPSEVTRLQRKGYILMQPFNFWISSQEHIQRKKNSRSSLDPFHVFSGRKRKEREDSWRRTEKHRETQREKLPIKTTEITGAPSDTLACALADKREPSAKHIPVLF